MAGKRRTEEPTVVAEESGAAVAEVKTGLYWLGTTKDSPFQNVTAKAIDRSVTFHQFTNAIDKDDEGQDFVGHKLPGIVLELELDEVQAVLKDIEDKVVTCSATVWKAGPHHIRRKSDPRYKSIPKQERPLGRFLYLMPVEDREGFNRSKEPAPIVAADARAR